MKKLLLVIIVAGVAAFQIFKSTDQKAFEEHSRKRVQSMLECLQRGDIPSEQDAIGYWRVGHPEAPSQDTVNDFARFRSVKGLGAVQSFTLVSSQLVDSTDTASRYVDITCQVNGRTLHLRARHARPLEWAD